MKKLLTIALITLFSYVSFGQKIAEGSLISVHIMSITLKPDVTIDQYLDFFQESVIPELEKNFSCRIHLGTGLNREIQNEVGMLWFYKSKEVFNKFWNDDGSATEAGQAGVDALGGILEELGELGTFTRYVEDWLIQ